MGGPDEGQEEESSATSVCHFGGAGGRSVDGATCVASAERNVAVGTAGGLLHIACVETAATPAAAVTPRVTLRVGRKVLAASMVSTTATVAVASAASAGGDVVVCEVPRAGGGAGRCWLCPGGRRVGGAHTSDEPLCRRRGVGGRKKTAGGRRRWRRRNPDGRVGYGGRRRVAGARDPGVQGRDAAVLRGAWGRWRRRRRRPDSVVGRGREACRGRLLSHRVDRAQCCGGNGGGGGRGRGGRRVRRVVLLGWCWCVPVACVACADGLQGSCGCCAAAAAAGVVRRRRGASAPAFPRGPLLSVGRCARRRRAGRRRRARRVEGRVAADARCRVGWADGGRRRRRRRSSDNRRCVV